MYGGNRQGSYSGDVGPVFGDNVILFAKGFDFACDAHREIGCVEASDGPDAAFTVTGRMPEGLDGMARGSNAALRSTASPSRMC